MQAVVARWLESYVRNVPIESQHTLLLGLARGLGATDVPRVAFEGGAAYAVAVAEASAVGPENVDAKDEGVSSFCRGGERFCALCW